MKHQKLSNLEAFDIVIPESLELPVDARPPMRAQGAAPDMPKAAGVFLVAAYALLMGAFLLTIRGAHSEFAILIGFFYLAMFFGIPAVMLRVAGEEGRRPGLVQFLDRGVDTATGRISGAGALVQMLIVPALLSLAVLAMGITYIVS